MPAPELSDLGRRLVDMAGYAALVQVERERQAADSASDDRNVHVRAHSLAACPPIFEGTAADQHLSLSYCSVGARVKTSQQSLS
jgi:hypothetical protein